MASTEYRIIIYIQLEFHNYSTRSVSKFEKILWYWKIRNIIKYKQRITDKIIYKAFVDAASIVRCTHLSFLEVPNFMFNNSHNLSYWWIICSFRRSWFFRLRIRSWRHPSQATTSSGLGMTMIVVEIKTKSI